MPSASKPNKADTLRAYLRQLFERMLFLLSLQFDEGLAPVYTVDVAYLACYDVVQIV